MEVKTLLVLLYFLLDVFYVTECVRGNVARRRRSEPCPKGNYTLKNGLMCCLCPEGHHLEADCQSHLSVPLCESCTPTTYMNHPNHDSVCEPCKQCHDFGDMVVEQKCTPISNTVCRCRDGYFCDKGDECRVCYEWKRCDFGIKVEGNHTHDRQCNENGPEGSKSSTAFVIPIVICVILAIAAIAAVFVLRKRKKFCFKPPEPMEQDESLEPLDDPELFAFLPRIAEILGFKVVRSVVRRQGALSQTRIDDIMDENPQDTRERTYQLLKAWYEAHGMNGAYRALRENLIGLNEKRKANAVRELINGEQRNGGVVANGNV